MSLVTRHIRAITRHFICGNGLHFFFLLLNFFFIFMLCLSYFYIKSFFVGYPDPVLVPIYNFHLHNCWSLLLVPAFLVFLRPEPEQAGVRPGQSPAEEDRPGHRALHHQRKTPLLRLSLLSVHRLLKHDPQRNPPLLPGCLITSPPLCTPQPSTCNRSTNACTFIICICMRILAANAPVLTCT